MVVVFHVPPHPSPLIARPCSLLLIWQSVQLLNVKLVVHHVTGRVKSGKPDMYSYVWALTALV